MNLRQELDEILGRMKFVVGVFIMDKDGLVVERAERPGVQGLEDSFIEFMQGFRTVSASALEVGEDPVEELTILCRRNRYVFRRLDENYYVILAMTREGCLGEASWRMRRAASNMAADFEG